MTSNISFQPLLACKVSFLFFFFFLCFSDTYPYFNIFCLFLLLKWALDSKISDYTKNGGHWCSTGKPTGQDRQRQQVARGRERLKQRLTIIHRKLTLSNRSCLNSAQVTLVTALEGGPCVSGFRFYTTIPFLPCKSSWLAWITGSQRAPGRLSVFQNTVVDLVDVLRDLGSSALQRQHVIAVSWLDA